MIDLASITHSAFEGLTGQSFVLRANLAVELTLLKVEVLGNRRPEAIRDPFALQFGGVPNLRVPQGIYRLEHAEMGEMELFLVQTGANTVASEFEAIFS